MHGLMLGKILHLSEICFLIDNKKSLRNRGGGVMRLKQRDDVMRTNSYPELSSALYARKKMTYGKEGIRNSESRVLSGRGIGALR